MGFILAYLGDEGGKKGFISAVGVLPQYRGKGVGSALLERGVEALRGEGGKGSGGAKGDWRGEEEGNEEMNVVIGSETPRFWPGLPTTFGGGVGVWFGKRGMSVPISFSSLRVWSTPVMFIFPLLETRMGVDYDRLTTR